MKTHEILLKMMYIDKYCTDFMFRMILVGTLFTYKIYSRNDFFPFSFQDITLVC